MTNDETQRKMDFILDQQAQFSADLQHLNELHAQAATRYAKTEDTMTRLASATLILTQRMVELSVAQAHMDNKLANLGESHEKLTESQARLAESQTQLAESQEHTDQRLNALIDIVKDNMNGRR